MIFYFTGTGNSLYVAKKIGGNLVSIAQAAREQGQFYHDDVIGFVFPTYAVGIPRIVKKFVLNNRFEAEYSFAVMTCGGVLGSSLMSFEKMAEAQGLKLDYTNKVTMIDNYGVQSMDKKLRKHIPQKENARIEEIAVAIQRRHHSLMRSNLLVQGFTKLMNASSGFCYDDADKHFTVRTEQCVKCGLCRDICPAGNIALIPYPVFSHKCEGCYACIHSCPRKAISPNSHTVKVQYRHPGIKQKEILMGNKK